MQNTIFAHSLKHAFLSLSTKKSIPGAIIFWGPACARTGGG
jgi:hypothetical protein